MKKLNIIVAIFFISSIVTAQKTILPKEDYNNKSVVSPAGSTFQNAETSITWTLGDTLYTLSEYNSEEIPSELIDLNLSIKAYPNPTKNHLIITCNTEMKESFNIVVFDSSGKKLFKKRMSQNKNLLNLEHLPSAFYVIRIMNSKEQLIKTFKILKN